MHSLSCKELRMALDDESRDHPGKPQSSNPQARPAPPHACRSNRVLSSAPVLRRLLFLVFAVFLIQETNLGSLLLGAECVETCPDDTSPGHCPPTCATCSCGTHVNPVVPRVAALASPAPRPCRPSFEATVPPASRHIGEILHVPKPALA